MELQWPLILFTSFISWSAGLFGTQGILILRGRRTKAHLTLLVVSLVLMVVGGIAVFMHLEHWERIFNGFGHLSSGITQELIGIVAMVVVMVLVFASLRRSGDGSVPKWCGALALVVAIALMVAMGHSYLMASRPAWDNVMQIFSLFGAACVLGPATAAVVLAARGDDPRAAARPLLVGSVLNAVATVGYLATMAAAQGAYTDIGYYYDPTQIARGMIDFQGATGLLDGGRLPLVAVIVVLAVVPIVVALVLARKGAGKDARTGADAADATVVPAAGAWVRYGAIAVIAAFVGAIILRVVFYELGAAVYIFF